jgi:hypothetical protein
MKFDVAVGGGDCTQIAIALAQRVLDVQLYSRDHRKVCRLLFCEES